MAAIRERVLRRWGNRRMPVREIVGRVASKAVQFFLWGGSRGKVDDTVPDYVWWDNFRHGRKSGYELAGLLAKPAAEIYTSWILGEGVEAKLAEPDEHTDDLLSRFMKRIQGVLWQMFNDLFSLGEQYVIVNADGSLSVPSPDMVQKITHPVQYQEALGYVITTETSVLKIEDEYRLDGRTLRITNKTQKPVALGEGVTLMPKATIEYEYENLIGRLPVVHFVNDRQANETHGRPVFAAALRLFRWYNELMVKGLTGAKRLSNPILAFMGVEDLDETKDANSTDSGETYQDVDGSLQRRERLDIDEETPAVMAGAGSRIEFIGPNPGFTQDVRNMLKSLYLLFSEHLGIPDVVMGFELGQARASATEQMKTWYARIMGRRLALEGQGADAVLGVDAQGGLYELIDIWLRWRQVTDKRVQVGQVIIDWPSLSERDEQMRKAWADSAYDRGLLRDETYLAEADLVEDAVEEVELAREEQDERRDPFEKDVDAALADTEPVIAA